MTDSPNYDIAVSFAGAQQAVVEPIVRACQALGLEAFYDKDKTVEFWGRNFIYDMRAIYGGARNPVLRTILVGRIFGQRLSGG